MWRGRAVNIWRANSTIITLTPRCPFFCSAVQLDSCGTQNSGHPEHQDGALRRHEQRGLPLHLGMVSVHVAQRLCCFSHPLAKCHYASPGWKSASSLPLLYALVLSWLNTVYRRRVTTPHAFLMQLCCVVVVSGRHAVCVALLRTCWRSLHSVSSCHWKKRKPHFSRSLLIAGLLAYFERNIATTQISVLGSFHIIMQLYFEFKRNFNFFLYLIVMMILSVSLVFKCFADFCLFWLKGRVPENRLYDYK